jgi:type IV pilus assembly protein PilO
MAENSTVIQNIQDELKISKQPSKPTLFRIFTPTTGGILIAVLGLLGTLYGLVHYVQPLWQRKQELEQPLVSKRLQLSKQQQTLQHVTEAEQNLEIAKRQYSDVLSLYLNPDQLNTLRHDLDRIAEAHPNVRVTLKPVTSKPEPVTDNSLGEAAKEKIHRQIFTVKFEGPFQAIYSIISTLERLQPSLIFNAFKAQFSEQRAMLSRAAGSSSTVLELKTDDKIKITFNLVVLSSASLMLTTSPETL